MTVTEATLGGRHQTTGPSGQRGRRRGQEGRDLVAEKPTSLEVASPEDGVLQPWPAGDTVEPGAVLGRVGLRVRRNRPPSPAKPVAEAPSPSGARSSRPAAAPAPAKPWLPRSSVSSRDRPRPGRRRRHRQGWPASPRRRPAGSESPRRCSPRQPKLPALSRPARWKRKSRVRMTRLRQTIAVVGRPGHGRHAHHLQRGGHERGHGPAQPVQGPVRKAPWR